MIVEATGRVVVGAASSLADSSTGLGPDLQASALAAVAATAASTAVLSAVPAALAAVAARAPEVGERGVVGPAPHAPAVDLVAREVPRSSRRAVGDVAVLEEEGAVGADASGVALAVVAALPDELLVGRRAGRRRRVWRACDSPDRCGSRGGRWGCPCSRRTRSARGCDAARCWGCRRRPRRAPGGGRRPRHRREWSESCQWFLSIAGRTCSRPACGTV